MRLTRAIIRTGALCVLLGLGAACDEDGEPAPEGTPAAKATAEGIDLALALPPPEHLEMPGLVPATDSGAFNADYATHYTLAADDSPEELVAAGFVRGHAVTYYRLNADGQTSDATLLLYVAEFASSSYAETFVNGELTLPQDNQPIDNDASTAFHVGRIEPPDLPLGFAALHFDVRTADGSYSVAFAAGARGRYAEVVWASFEDDAAAQASLGSFATALDSQLQMLLDKQVPGDETRSEDADVPLLEARSRRPR